MERRDYLAGLALQAIIRKSNTLDMTLLCSWAVDAADKLILELDKGNENEET